MGAAHQVIMPATPVPESVQKKKATQDKLAAAAAADAAAAKQARKEKRIQAYKNAEKYVQEYRAVAKQRVRMHRQAKAAGNHFVDGEAKLMFVVRIRGLADMHPKTKKILQLMRLRQMNMGVFMKASKPALEMIKRVEPYLSYGYPSLKSVRDLIYKRGFGKLNKQRIPLNDNAGRAGPWGEGHHVHGGPRPRDLHCRPQLQGSQQLLVALQAAPCQGWPSEEAQGLL